MADPSSYRPRPGEIPQEPGVYRFRDKDGRVIYVGKAKSLRSRLSSYFQDTAALHPRTRSMVAAGAGVEWTVVANEVEALQLEYSWIKAFDPRFNVKYRDDKSYPYLAVTLGEEFPRAQVLRGAKRPGTRYFGPYAHAWAIRETLDLLLRVFPLRTCSNGVFRRAGQVGRPCLLGYIDKCSAPCVGRVDAEHHRLIAEDFCEFMGGSTHRFVSRLERDMRNAAAQLDFERAARLRDDVKALNTALERSTMVLPDGTDADVFAMAGDELEAAVQVFHVRGGRVRGQRGWVLERQDEDDGLLVEHLLQRVFGDEAGDAVPREVLVPSLPAEPGPLAEWLTGLRGSHVDLRVPRRGDKRALMDTVQRNAQQALARHKVARAGDLTARGQALQELQEGLGLDEAPLRIECYDISHVQGSHPVGSMVVFEDGLPRKSEYRRFLIKGLDGAAEQGRPETTAEAQPDRAVSGEPAGDPAGAAGRAPTRNGAANGTGHGGAPVVRSDDTAAMREVLTRRFRRLQEGPGDGDDTAAATSRRFVYPPQLVVVDGGAPQVDAAAAALADVGAGHVQVVGLAKRLEEVWLPGETFPVVLPRTSEGLFLLQRLRDEAHRFAITFHRQRRSKAMTASALDAIPGLGPARRAALLKKFGSVKRLRAARPEDLCSVDGIGPVLAQTIHAHLASSDKGLPGGVNLATGEVVD